MVRLRIAAGAAVLAASTALPAVAQTVGDYQDSLRKAPVLDSTPAQVAEACKTLSNYATVMIPEAQTTFGSIITALVPTPGAPVGDMAQRRANCVEARSLAVVTFDDKSGTPLLTPPLLEDPEKAFSTTTTPLPGTAPAPSGRAPL